jgi:hypothetical protein
MELVRQNTKSISLDNGNRARFEPAALTLRVYSVIATQTCFVFPCNYMLSGPLIGVR